MRKAMNILGTILRILGMLFTIPSFLLSLPGMLLILIGEAIEEESVENEKLARGIEEEHNNRQI
jgi:uncharacterized membrane protein